MRDPQAMLRPDAIADNRATNLNLYPKKRELEKQVRTGLGQDFYRKRSFVHKWQRLAGTCLSQIMFLLIILLSQLEFAILQNSYFP